MKCSVKNCPNTTYDNPDEVYFHGFPTNVEVLHKWVTFTERNNFIPKLSSKICSAHFDEEAYILKPTQLKFRAVPMLKVPPRIATSRGIKVATFALDMQTNAIEEKDPLAGDSYLDNSKLNSERKSLCATALPNFKEEPSSSSSGSFISQVNTPVGSLESNLGLNPVVSPIKLVDMNKLLKKKSLFEKEAINSVSYSNHQEEEKEDTHTRLSHELQPNQTAKCEDIKLDSNSYSTDVYQKMTVSKILECLRVILPVKFDLTKLIPNDKISLLVLRYLKVENSQEFNSIVQLNLKIIVDTAKIQVTEFGEDLKHPYLEITDENLEKALNKCLPKSFSMSDVSNDVLNCLCFVMEQGIFSDGYHILRRKIRKYTREGLIFNEIITQTSESNTASKVETDYSKNPQNKRKQPIVVVISEPIGLNQEKSYLISNESRKKQSKVVKNVAIVDKTAPKENSQIERLEKSNINIQSNTQSKTNHTVAKPYDGTTDQFSQKKSPSKERIHTLSAHDNDSKKSAKEESTPRPHPLENLDSILTYLKNQQCSAKDALTSFRLMFYLCKFLQVKCNQANLQKIKSSLRYIAEKKLCINGLKNKQQLFSRKVLFEHSPRHIFKDSTTDKLKMRPIVKLRNLVDYKKDQLVFMNAQKHNHKAGFYSQIPILSQSTPVKLQRYANDYIKKITNEEFKTFRKIIVKKCNSKFVARIKYKNVTPGCSVFVKDYRNIPMGWVKGKVLSTAGHFTYVVQLDNGDSLQCVLDQIRPVPDVETLPTGLRTPRAVKPKQMFDL